MEFAVLPVTPFAQNCTLVWCPDSLEGAIIDPGGDLERILALVAEKGVKVGQILLTHGHIDHAGAAARLRERLKVPIIGPHRDDQFWLDRLGDQSRMFQFPDATPFSPDRYLEEGDVVELGDTELEVLHCPGHTPGHVVFFHRPSRLAQVGDVLFKGSIGRTDFPRGNHDQLISSIRDKLFGLGDEVRFIPGHGPMSTLGEERRTNPFVADPNYG
ncbi:MBL fold metallo-hydrolase [Gallaecimonas sp. GXIMD4217]|uniref:MBL fold metallo-hydrolase n=1 Tax=Gallaecimonas sp. GXIMD4217 TaxID=3131927 RepID=UPI00311AD254